MSRYVVMSRHVPDEEGVEPFDMAEVSRTVFAVAQQDASIIRECFHRKAWVVDTEEGK